MPLTHRCSTCKVVKPLSEFNKNRYNKNGHHHHCRPGHRQRQRQRRDPAQARRTMLRWKYGITPEQWDVMHEAQGGRCAICGTDSPQPTGKAKDGQFHVDHDHVTGKVRGLLCRNCNTVLGLVEESAFVLESAIQYLASHKEMV